MGSLGIFLGEVQPLRSGDIPSPHSPVASLTLPTDRLRRTAVECFFALSEFFWSNGLSHCEGLTQVRMSCKEERSMGSALVTVDATAVHEVRARDVLRESVDEFSHRFDVCDLTTPHRPSKLNCFQFISCTHYCALCITTFKTSLSTSTLSTSSCW